MVFKYPWMHDYFEGPFSRENWRIGLAPRPTYTYYPYKRTAYGYNDNRALYAADIPVWCCSGVILLFIFWPVGIALLGVGCGRTVCELARPPAEPEILETTYVYY
jgi:hypothetical protein